MRTPRAFATANASSQSREEGFPFSERVICLYTNAATFISFRPPRELFESMNGSWWQNKDGWRSELPLLQWHGVTTNDDGSVSKLLSGPELRNERTGRLTHY